jgi:hypothetical protein
MNQKKIKEAILSNEIINNIVKSNRWGINHGSNIIEYFIDNDLEIEYGDSKLRKKIIKEYISKKINHVFNDILNESPDFLYRSVYLREAPEVKGVFGIYWSSKELTAPCVEHSYGTEYLLKIDFNNSLVDWTKTILSRLDYIYGEQEKEYQLFNNVLTTLVNYEEIKDN